MTIPTQPSGDAPGMILLLSHMRSYSTLLSHILNSNPAVAGFAERHESYGSTDDVRKAASGLVAGSDAIWGCDNVLHNAHKISDEVLRSDDVQLIFSIRNPTATLRSLWRWGGKDKMYREPGVAAEYYCRRLDQLEEMAESVAGRFIFVNPQAVVDYPDAALGELTDALGLATPLSSSYDVDHSTGDPRTGDFSPHIRTGEIQQDRDHPLKAQLSYEDVEKAKDTFREVRSRLAKKSRVAIKKPKGV